MQHWYRALYTMGVGFGWFFLVWSQPTLAREPDLKAGATAGAASKLGFTAAEKEYRFDTGVFRGTLRSGGRAIGLGPVLEVSSGTPMAGKYGLFSPYRLLTADARFGTGAWDWTSQAQLMSDGSVQSHWLPDKTHPLEMTAVYRWTASNVLDFCVTVKPQGDVRRFELFLASYFDGFPASLVYVQQNPESGGKPGFMEARKSVAPWQTFPRDDEAVRIYADGRWKRPPNPVAWKMMPRLAAPVALRRDAKSGLTAVLMAPAEDCFAISTPFSDEGHRSVYLSLLGRDLKAGQSAAARARLVLGRAISDQQAIALYEEYVKK